MIEIFESDNYREIIKSCLLDKKKIYGRDYTFEKMARACRLQRTYLSSVLAGNGHLNSDQVYMACQFLGFDDNEYHYVSLLHEFDKSVFPKRKKHLQTEIDRLRKKSLRTEAHINSPVSSVEGMNDFYLDFNAQLIHMFLTVSKYRENTNLLMQKLGLHKSRFLKSLRTVETAGLISVKDGAITVLKDNFHLPSESSYYPSYRSQMRLHALEQMQRQYEEDQYSFSVLFSSNDEIRKRIQGDFLKFLDRAQKLSQGSETEEVYQINFDLLKWS